MILYERILLQLPTDFTRDFRSNDEISNKNNKNNKKKRMRNIYIKVNNALFHFTRKCHLVCNHAAA